MRLAVFIFILAFSVQVRLAQAEEESQNVCLFAVPKSFVTLPDISVESAKESVVEFAKSVPERVGSVAVALADKLEATKKTPTLSTVVAGDTGAEDAVANTFDEKPDNLGGNLTAAVYNAGVDLLSILLRHWLWTISGLAALFIFWSFRT